jgi:cell wall-active antibiotic response 4TMS protein YvqF/B-box zinc finger protein
MNCAIHNQAPATAYCRTCGKALCHDCTREVKGLVYCEDCLAAGVSHAAPAAAANGSGPNATVAAIISFFFPGIGQVYAGDVTRGVMVALVFAGLIFGVVNTGGRFAPFFGIGIAFWYFFQIFDAYRVAKARQTGTVAPDPLGLSTPRWSATEDADSGKRGMPMGAVILIVVGVLLLFGNLFDFSVFSRGWPLILVAFGAMRMFQLMRYRRCHCVRCMSACMMWPAVLVTLGALFLLDENTRIEFDRTWPILIIVIGGIKFLQLSGSTEGHIAPEVPAPAPPAQVSQQTDSDQVHHG